MTPIIFSRSYDATNSNLRKEWFDVVWTQSNGEIRKGNLIIFSNKSSTKYQILSTKYQHLGFEGLATFRVPSTKYPNLGFESLATFRRNLLDLVALYKGWALWHAVPLGLTGLFNLRPK